MTTREFPRVRSWLDSRNVDTMVNSKVSHASVAQRSPAVQSVAIAKEIPRLNGSALPPSPRQ